MKSAQIETLHAYKVNQNEKEIGTRMTLMTRIFADFFIGF